MKTINKFLKFINFITPINLNYSHNIGSLLFITIIFQIISGILISFHYTAHIIYSFSSISHIIRNVNSGYLLHNIHSNLASIIFILLYIHIARGIYFGNYIKYKVWFVGIILFLLLMITSFLGYVLPWGQMSYWGATVITNFISAIPYIGNTILLWLWGGFSIGNPTLNRFYSFHFISPFIILIFIFLHIYFLHKVGSSNPENIDIKFSYIKFTPYYFLKDLHGFFVTLIPIILLLFFYPYLLGDPENYIKANSLITPNHIMPEWYFLFAYAILRSIPNKLGGIFGLLLSILILFILPLYNFTYIQGNRFNPIGKLTFWFLVCNFILLSWLGSKFIEHPYIIIGIISTIYYFISFIINIPLSIFINHWIIYYNIK
uniref:cytochrome b n=1 Tax=Gymnopraia lapislazula TaxID=316224 RepID=UPI0026E31ADD|nr:cytochrome b [Gymnopraia lapislazula]WJJ70115.1 cytochrome b [Gymnopraia lapislazula]